MREEVRNWLLQAKRDLKSAENSLKSGDYYLVAFVCQQAVEKGLKALLMIRTRERKIITHSLIELGKKANANDEIMKDLRKMAPEYTISRYPDVTDTLPFENYDYEIANDLLNRAKRIFKWLDTQIKE